MSMSMLNLESLPETNPRDPRIKTSRIQNILFKNGRLSEHWLQVL